MTSPVFEVSRTLPPMPSSEAPKMTPNPVQCQKFVVNMFKAGSGKCRDCGHEWHQHEGVIDKQVAEKFVQIWVHNHQPLKQAAHITTSDEVREERKRALIEANRKAKEGEHDADWFTGQHQSATSSAPSAVAPTKVLTRSTVRSIHDNTSDEEEDEFKYYSREEYLAKMAKPSSGLSGASTTTGGTPLVRSSSGSPFVSSVAKPVKVVNLLDFNSAEDAHTSDTRPSPVVSSVVDPLSSGMRKMEEIEHQVSLMRAEGASKDSLLSERSKELHAKQLLVAELEGKLERAKGMVREMEETLERNREEGMLVIAEMERIRADNEKAVTELGEKLALAEAELMEVKVDCDRVAEELKGKSAEVEALQVELGRVSAERDALVQEGVRVRAVVQDLECKLEESLRVATGEGSHAAEIGEALRLAQAEVERKLIEVSELSAVVDESTRSLRTVEESLVRAEVTANAKVAELELAVAEKERLVVELGGVEEGMRLVEARLVEKEAEADKLKFEFSSLAREKILVEQELAAERSTTAELQARLGALMAEKSGLVEDASKSTELRVRIEELESAYGKKEAELRALVAELDARTAEGVSVAEEVRSLREEVRVRAKEVSEVRAEMDRSTGETMAEIQKHTENVDQLTAALKRVEVEVERERSECVSAKSELVQANRVIEGLNAKVTELSAVSATVSESSAVKAQSEQYLKAIQDVSFVMKTVTDKFISPNVSEAVSRAVSMESEGHEAVTQLERSVRGILRLVESTADKAKIIEKENSQLENKLNQYESINRALRERMNQSFVQRLVQPLIACRWSQQDVEESNPIRPNGGNEMSHFPQRQQSMPSHSK